MGKSSSVGCYKKASKNFASNIVMRPIQTTALDLLEMNTDQEFDVFAVCPGGGKTIATIQKILEWAQKGEKTLVLAHGTNVLKNQWTRVLSQFVIPFETKLGTNSLVVVSIPHAIYRSLPNKLDFDHIVIDEAHEFFYADMVQGIISRMKSGCRVLALTGTPSVFIARKVCPIVVSAVDVYNEGHLSDTYFGMIKGSQVIEDSDYNDEKEVKATYTEKKEDLESTVKKTIKSLSKRIAKEIGKEGASPKDVFLRLGKTLIAARNIKQAELIHEFLFKSGVNSALSTSKTDQDSENMELFLNNPDESVLIVVKRGILGFDMPRLVCAIDFTGSRNINRIYQLYARVLRKHPEGKQKYFYRICCANQPQKDELHMTAALCLANTDFISKFNGKNLSDLEIPVRRKRDRDNEPGKVGGDGSFGVQQLEDEDLIDEVRKMIFLNRMKSDSAGSAYSYVKFGVAISNLDGKLFHTSSDKDEALLEWARTHSKRPSAHSKDPAEKTLAHRLVRVTSQSSKVYDAELTEKLKFVAPTWFEKGLSALNNKEQIMKIALSGGDRPSQRTGSEAMKKLAKALQNYISPTNRAYDREFQIKIQAARPDWFNQSSATKSKLLARARAGLPRPSQSSKDLEEKRLGKLLTSYTTPGSSFDESFTQKIQVLAPIWFKVKSNHSYLMAA